MQHVGSWTLGDRVIRRAGALSGGTSDVVGGVRDSRIDAARFAIVREVNRRTG